jgi:hypothetical protein
MKLLSAVTVDTVRELLSFKEKLEIIVLPLTDNMNSNNADKLADVS